MDDSLVPLSEDDYLGFSTRDHDPFDLPVLPMREIIMPFRIKVRVLTSVLSAELDIRQGLSCVQS